MKTYYFVFCKEDLLLEKTADDAYTIPLQEEPPTEVKPWTHQMNITPMADGTPVVTYRIDEPITDNARYEMIGLRQSYYKLPRPLYLKAGKCQELLYWDQNTKYCGVCGAPTKWMTDISKKCPECGKEWWPSPSTAIIVRVCRMRPLDNLQSDNCDKGNTIQSSNCQISEVLLVRARNFRSNHYGLVAGFLETGESLEECVERELREEVGIRIKNLKYFGSQPWPYPFGLMVGFTADYADGEIRLQKEELTEGGWFTRDNMPPIPDKASIARRLIDDWLLAEP